MFTIRIIIFTIDYLQPDSEAEPEKGAQSEQQNEMVAKDDELDQDPESTGNMSCS